MTEDEIEAHCRAYLGPKEESIPWEVYYRSLADLIFVHKQMARGLRHRDGRWRRLREGES